MMKALLVQDGTLVLGEREVPAPARGEIRIRVMAAGINRPDVYQRKGNYPAPAGVDPDIPGLEVAGIVDEVGTGVTAWQTGDQVCALVAGGGYAQFVCVDQRQVLPKPEELQFEEAAGLCETLFTVWSNVFMRGHFTAGEHVLVHGGSSGIGVAAIQLVKALGGLIIVTAGTSDKCEFCERLGADIAINYRTEDFLEVIKERDIGIDIILDMIGGEYTPRNLKLLNTEGRLIMINAMQGRIGEVDLLRVMRNRLIITGSTLRARDSAFKGRIRDELLATVWPLIEAGKIKPVIYKVFGMNEAQQAHEMMEESTHMGKIILKIET